MFLHHLTSAFFQFAMRRFVKNTNALEKVKVIWYNVTYNDFSSNSRDILYLYDESGIAGLFVDQAYSQTKINDVILSWN